MTSTLPANNPFGKVSSHTGVSDYSTNRLQDVFAGSALYGRNGYGNSLVTESNISRTGLLTNIWQPSRNDLLPIRTQMARNGNSLVHHTREARPTEPENLYQNPRDFSSVTSRAKGTFQTTSNVSGKQSPTVCQGISSSSTEPLSAHSRSNNESAALTPSSNISVSDQFPAHIHTMQDSKPRMAMLQSHQAPANAWTSAKEFRPKLSLMSNQLSSADGGSRPSATERDLDLASRAATFNKSWSQRDLDTGHSGSAIRNDFRPVLPLTGAIPNSANHYPQARNNLHDVGRSEYESMRSSNSTIAEPAQTYYTQNLQQFNQPTPQSKVYFQSMIDDGQNVHYKGNFQSGYRNLLDKQMVNYRYSHSLQPYGNEYPLEDYYRKPMDAYYTQNASARTDPGMQSFRTYNYYADEMAGYGFPAPPQYSTSAPQDGRNGYHNDSTLTSQYTSADHVQDRAPENQQIYRSPLLEEFRVNKSRKYELKDIYDHVVEFSGDQLGSRFIQQKLEVANSDEKDRVFNEVARDSRQLMTDVFGNYVIQKMFEHGNQSQKKLLASHMRGHIYALSLQTYGCRVVQKAFEHILTDQQGELIKELDGNVLKVVENQNGNHVIQKAIEMIPGEHIQFIVDAHQGHVHHLSKHPYGCRVIQRMLEYCQPHAKRQILDELHLNISELIQDAFGNYVVQHVIVNGEPSDRKAVIDKVQSKLLENAMHKFASNVVEKALDNADEHQRRAMLQRLTGRDESGQSTATRLLTHQFGNYVIRKCFGIVWRRLTDPCIEKSTAHLTGQTLASTIEEMESYLSQLQRVSSGKQVCALQKSILEARKRLDRQSHNTNNLHYVPTYPRTEYGRR